MLLGQRNLSTVFWKWKRAALCGPHEYVVIGQKESVDKDRIPYRHIFKPDFGLDGMCSHAIHLDFVLMETKQGMNKQRFFFNW